MSKSDTVIVSFYDMANEDAVDPLYTCEMNCLPRHGELVRLAMVNKPDGLLGRVAGIGWTITNKRGTYAEIGLVIK
jgi:hypothetical protein